MTDAQPGLRARHTDLTRETIMRALVEVVRDGGLPDFSVQEVAERAGVSHRTVYRHYPSRDDLLAGLMTWVEEQMVELGAPFSADDAAELLAAADANFDVFDRLADEVEAMTRFSLSTGTEPATRQDRTAMFARLVEDELCDLDDEQARAVAGVVRLLTSSRAWLVLRQDGITAPEHVSAALPWAVRVLLDAARRGDAPTLDGDRVGDPGDEPGSR